MSNRQALSSWARWRCLLRLGATLLLALGSTGCLNWSGDVSKYRQVLDGKHPPASPSFTPTAPLTLVRALQLTNADNEAIASRGEDYIQALADKMRDAGTFLPTFSLNPSYSRWNSIGGVSVPSGSGTSVISPANYQFTVPLNASMTGSLTNASNLQAAGKTAAQQVQLLLDERETILLQVVQAYYNVLRSERQAVVYEDGVKVKAEKVRDQQARLKLGNVKPLDLAQSQSDLAATQVQLIQTRTDALNYRSALARLMGVSAVTGPLTDAFIPPADVAAIARWQLDAARQRQDLLAAQRQVQAARLSLEAAVHEYCPSVSVDFSYLLHNEPPSPQTWTGVFSANVPIFSALVTESDIRRAWSVYRQAGLMESQTRRQVTDDVNEGYENLQASRRKIAQLTVEVEAAQRAVTLSERMYQLGSESNLDRLTQQDNLLNAQLNLISEQFNEKSSYLNLLRATGRLATVLQVPV